MTRFVITAKSNNFLTIDEKLASCGLLSTVDKAVYLTLCYFERHNMSESDICNESIALLVNCSIDEVKKSVKTLVNDGFIGVEVKNNLQGRN